MIKYLTSIELDIGNSDSNRNSNRKKKSDRIILSLPTINRIFYVMSVIRCTLLYVSDQMYSILRQ